MGMPYYRWFPGDYARDTRHLSMLQDGAYRRLIDMYMDTQQPIPNDLQRIYRWIHAEGIEERAATEFVLSEFFELSTGKRIGWIHKRCDIELDWRKSKMAKATESIRKRWNNERNSNEIRTYNVGNTNQNQNNTKAARAKLADQLPNLQWWETESGMLAKGQTLGTAPRPGEGWPQFKDRLFVAIRAIDTSDKTV